ncbi:beta-ketoacyl-[acyl-carrier-protein] synthase family protein [Nonomuraea sp. NPDC050451]|uniref:beta-ketoacyl-[acyl-carrier-protein] synthase family protein n=1 Tax=Nonomuraea sp. NPDC050451 TaxID=3364364 RepID=UPI00379F23EC
MIASMWDMRSSGGPVRARVVVTGMGVRTPAGAHPKELWGALLAGRSTARTITSFDAEGLPVDFACQVPDLDLDGYVKPRDARRMDRVTRMAFCAATDALADAGHPQAAPERRAVVTGTGYGGVATQEAAFGTLDERGRAWPGPLHIPMSMHNAAAAEISIRHAFLGPSMSVATACASGSHAIGEGMRLVRDGTADVVLAGGMEAGVRASALVGFGRAGALSRRASEPERASRPFDADRDGFVLGEGAAFLVLERLEDALLRGAHVYAELSGYGRTSDGHHLTAPDPEGDGAYRCMRQALADAGIAAADVVHVNAHATSTRLNDEMEARAIARLFGEYAVPVTGSKSVIGHALGASGAIEAVISVLTLRERAVHPTANLDRQDPACPVDVVTAPRPIVPGPVLSNSFAFGGHNATLVFTPFREDR